MEAFKFPPLEIVTGPAQHSTRNRKENGQVVPSGESSDVRTQRSAFSCPLWLPQSQPLPLPAKLDWSSDCWRSPAKPVAAATAPVEKLPYRSLESQAWQGPSSRLPANRDCSGRRPSATTPVEKLPNRSLESQAWQGPSSHLPANRNCSGRRPSVVSLQDGSYPPRKLAVHPFVLPRLPTLADLVSPALAVRRDAARTQPYRTGVIPPRFAAQMEHARTRSDRTLSPEFPKGLVLEKSWGIAYNPNDNNIYVSDRLEHCVYVLDLSGKLVRQIGDFGTRPQDFFRPAGVAIDVTRDRLLVADKDNHRVVVYETNGKLVCLFGNRGYQTGQFSYPWGIDVSKDGSRVVVADSHNHRVQVFDGANYEYIAKFTIFETCPYTYKRIFDMPRDVLFDPSGEHFYVTDFNVNVALKIDVNCTSQKIVNKTLAMSHPQGMAWDNFGNLLVCDSANNCIRVFSTKGQYIWSIPCKNFRPVKVAVLPNGKLVVADGTYGGVRIL